MTSIYTTKYLSIKVCLYQGLADQKVSLNRMDNTLCSQESDTGDPVVYLWIFSNLMQIEL